MNPALLAAIGAALASVYVLLDKLRPTSYGVNTWTVDGFINMFGIRGHVERIEKEFAATLTSGFRSPTVAKSIYENKDPTTVKALADAKGQSVEDFVAFVTSAGRHNRGLAGDFVSRLYSVESLTDKIYALAISGQIGPVQLVLNERNHVHVEWTGATEPRPSGVRKEAV